MTTLAILDPTTLLGREIQEQLEARRELWSELRLLTQDPESEGTLTEVRGGAAMVQALREDSLEQVDLAFLCGPGETMQETAETAPASTRLVAVSPDAPAELGPAVVAGVNLEAHRDRRLVVSPHPGVVALGHLLHPLADLGLARAVAFLVQPASLREQEGVDELLEQTRAILSFDQRRSWPVFRKQLAFNLLPARARAGEMQAQLGRILEVESPFSLQVVQGGVFHSLTCCLHLALEEDPGAEVVRQRLGEHALIELVEDPGHLGPIEAAAREEVLVGSVTPDENGTGAYWIWAAMDNLTRGGASNALAIAAALLD